MYLESVRLCYQKSMIHDIIIQPVLRVCQFGQERGNINFYGTKQEGLEIYNY
jgi:hypothetical protein